MGDEVNLQTKLADWTSAESLEVVQQVMEAEEEFDIVMSDSEAEQISTVGDVLRLIKQKRDRGGE